MYMQAYWFQICNIFGMTLILTVDNALSASTPRRVMVAITAFLVQVLAVLLQWPMKKNLTNIMYLCVGNLRVIIMVRNQTWHKEDDTLHVDM